MSASRPLLRTTSSTATARHVLNQSTARRPRSFFARLAKPVATAQPTPAPPAHISKPLTTLQQANPRNLPEVWFNPTFPYSNGVPPLGQGPDKPPDERKVKLGKSAVPHPPPQKKREKGKATDRAHLTALRILQERLPTLLQSPLPQEILAPNISLHLFPSTHPHLPTVSGRVAYIAALWTSPIAWNRLPIIGDVRLEILSERMVKEQGKRTGSGAEQLVVRWRTTGSSRIGWRLPFRERFQASEEETSHKGFTGLFIFEFDSEGRVLSHTIEHVQSHGEWENGVGAKFVGLTDWLFGGMRGGREGCPAFEIQRDDDTRRRR